jgi:hypothetical protein
MQMELPSNRFNSALLLVFGSLSPAALRALCLDVVEMMLALPSVLGDDHVSLQVCTLLL